jgi:hypothetical protein
LEQVSSQAVLLAAVEYAKNGDAGAQRFLRNRFPAETPFGAWARRVSANQSAGEQADGDGPPPEFMDELRDALARLQPAERQALRDALEAPLESSG